MYTITYLIFLSTILLQSTTCTQKYMQKCFSYFFSLFLSLRIHVHRSLFLIHNRLELLNTGVSFHTVGMSISHGFEMSKALVRHRIHQMYNDVIPEIQGYYGDRYADFRTFNITSVVHILFIYMSPNCMVGEAFIVCVFQVGLLMKVVPHWIVHLKSCSGVQY